jgi:hypothetical protein
MLNDLARRLDGQPSTVELYEELVVPLRAATRCLAPDGRCMLEAIGNLPEDEQEVFGLVRFQG